MAMQGWQLNSPYVTAQRLATDITAIFIWDKFFLKCYFFLVALASYASGEHPLAKCLSSSLVSYLASL